MGKAALTVRTLAAWAVAAASSGVSSMMLCEAEGGSDVFGFVPW